MSLDKFYTKKEVAEYCYSILKQEVSFKCILQPAAGSGRLVDACKCPVRAFDIKPDRNDIIEQDFLKSNLKAKNDEIVFMNPPFGLDYQFLNKAFETHETIAAILPISFKRYSKQKKVLQNAKLVYSEDLKENAFTFGEKDYNLRTCFQIWTTNSDKEDLRVRENKTSHDDFQMKIYNATSNTEKFLKEDWSMATYRTGMSEYKKYFKNSELSLKRQYVLFYPKTLESLKILLKIDFNKLSEAYAPIKGYSKSDVIKEYERIKILK